LRTEPPLRSIGECRARRCGRLTTDAKGGADHRRAGGDRRLRRGEADRAGVRRGANQNGASLELGEELLTDQEDTKVYGVSVGPPGEGESHGGREHGAGGSLVVLADADAGGEEVGRCRSAADLICFQAGNVVLRLEGEVSPTEVGTLSQAISEMAE
jgi:hypothetical protein